MQPSQKKEENLVEIYQDQTLTISQIKALYFNADAILEAPIKVFRIDSGGDRFSFLYGAPDFVPEYFISISALLRRTMPTPEHLLRWYANMGWEKAQAHVKERADYGTLMHIEFTQFLITKECDMNTIHERVQAYCLEREIVADPKVWTAELKKDILSFAQFCVDYDVKPLAIEITLVNREDGISTVIDLVADMYDKAYTVKSPLDSRKRVRKIIDYKSGKSGEFYESNEIQLHACKSTWDANFPDYSIDGVANFSPKDWRTEASYNYVDHTSKPSARKLPLLLELIKIDNYSPNRSIKFITGIVVFGQEPSANFKVVALNEFLTEKMNDLI